MGQVQSTAVSELGDGPSYADKLPDEILLELLSFVDDANLKSCRLVCTKWRDIFYDPLLWRRKCKRKGIPFLDAKSISKLQNSTKNVGTLFCSMYKIYTKNPFEKNLIKNPCGELQLLHWDCTGTSGNFIVEHPPIGSDNIDGLFPGSECNSCFATTCQLCTKSQTVDLWKEGLTANVLDILQPIVIATDWHAARFDCGSRYTLKIQLLKSSRERIVHHDELKTEEQWLGRAWSKEGCGFEEYGKGLHYVEITHSGVDTQFWAGHYGAKITGTCVIVKLPGYNPDNECLQ